MYKVLDSDIREIRMGHTVAFYDGWYSVRMATVIGFTFYSNDKDHVKKIRIQMANGQVTTRYPRTILIINKIK